MSATLSPLLSSAISNDQIASIPPEITWADCETADECLEFIDVLSVLQDGNAPELLAAIQLRDSIAPATENLKFPLIDPATIEFSPPVPTEIKADFDTGLSQIAPFVDAIVSTPPPLGDNNTVLLDASLQIPPSPMGNQTVAPSQRIETTSSVAKESVFSTPSSFAASPTAPVDTPTSKIQLSVDHPESFAPHEQRMPLPSAEEVSVDSSLSAAPENKIEKIMPRRPTPIAVELGSPAPQSQPALPQDARPSRRLNKTQQENVDTAVKSPSAPITATETAFSQTSMTGKDPSPRHIVDDSSFSSAESFRRSGRETLEMKHPEIQRHPLASAQEMNRQPDEVKTLPNRSLAEMPKEAIGNPVSDGSFNPEQSTSQSLSARPSTVTSVSNFPAQAQLPEKISAQISSAINSDGGGEIEIRLDPEELGRIRIVLSGKETGMNVNVFSERPEVVELMRRHSNLLEADLLAIGYKGADLSFHQEGGEDQASNQETTSQTKRETSVEPPQQTIQILAAGDDARLDIRF